MQKKRSANAIERHAAEAKLPRWLEDYRAHQRRYQAWCQYEEQLRALVPKALAVLERALDDPVEGPKLALAVLRAAGLWGLRPVREPDVVTYQLRGEFAGEETVS